MAWNPRPLADFSCKEGWGKGGRETQADAGWAEGKKEMQQMHRSGQPTQK